MYLNFVPDPDDLRVVAVGRTGEGKSATCSSLVMDKYFRVGASASSVTLTSNSKSAYVSGTLLRVVDTPGFFDTTFDPSKTKAEVKKCLELSYPGPHAFLFIVKIGHRFSRELKTTAAKFREIFGSRVTDYTIVVLTGLDNLEDDDSIHSLQLYIDRAPPELRQLISDCNGRVVGFNNKCRITSSENLKQVANLIKQVQNVARLNRYSGRYYTTGMLREAERLEREKEEKLRREYERKKEQEVARIRARVDANYEREMAWLRSDFDTRLQRGEENFQRQLARVREDPYNGRPPPGIHPICPFCNKRHAQGGLVSAIEVGLAGLVLLDAFASAFSDD